MDATWFVALWFLSGIAGISLLFAIDALKKVDEPTNREVAGLVWMTLSGPFILLIGIIHLITTVADLCPPLTSRPRS